MSIGLSRGWVGGVQNGCVTLDICTSRDGRLTQLEFTWLTWMQIATATNIESLSRQPNLAERLGTIQTTIESQSTMLAEHRGSIARLEESTDETEKTAVEAGNMAYNLDDRVEEQDGRLGAVEKQLRDI